MKKQLLFVLFIVLTISSINSQQLLWTSENGGTNQNGAVISYDLQTQQLATVASLGGNFMGNYMLLYDLEYSEPYSNTGGLVKGQDGNYYGINEFSNRTPSGTKGSFFRIDPNTNSIELLHTFADNAILHLFNSNGNYASFNNDFRYPTLGISEGEPGVFYGIAVKGGLYDRGGVWKFDTNGGGYSKVGDFDTLAGGVGREPNSPLIIGPNGDLFGVLKRRGAVGNSDADGHLYKVDIANQQLVYVKSLDAAGWAISEPSGQITYNSTLNIIYGTKDEFPGANYGGGVYSYNFNNDTVINETIITIGEVGVLGSNATGIIQANDGQYYFVCRNGGSSDKGTLVKYVPGVDTSTKLVDFQHQPNGTGMVIVGTKIYGSYETISEGEPLVWSYDVSTTIFEPSVVIGDDSNTLGHFISESFVVDGNKVIGHTKLGGDGDSGAFFEYNTISGTSTAIQRNVSEEGRGLIGEMLLLNNSTLLTYTGSGGPLNGTRKREHGGIVKIDLANNTAQYDNVLSTSYRSDVWDIYQSELRPLLTENNQLFVPQRKLASNGGTAFNTYRVNQNDGSVNNPLNVEPDDFLISSPLEFEDNKLVTAYLSKLFIYDDNTQNTQELSPTYDASVNGNMHYNLTKASNGLIYGLTKAADYSDSNSKASILEIDPSNWQITVKHSFESDVKETNIGLTEYNGKLWGSTISGGNNGAGYLYNIEISSGTFTKVYDFDYATDGGVFAGQWTEYNGILYATSYTGGSLGYGTLVSYNPSNTTFTVLEHLSLANGRSYKSTPLVWDPNSLSVNEASLDSTLQLYPNPVNDILYINNQNLKEILIFDLTGRKVMYLENTREVNTSKLTQGIYLVVARDKEGRSLKSKFIKK